MYHTSRFGECTGGLHVSIWVHYSEKNDWGQGVLIDCASVITLDALSVITPGCLMQPGSILVFTITVVVDTSAQVTPEVEAQGVELSDGIARTQPPQVAEIDKHKTDR